MTDAAGIQGKPVALKRRSGRQDGAAALIAAPVDARAKGAGRTSVNALAGAAPLNSVDFLMTERSIIRSRAPLRLGFAGGGTDLSPYCDQHGGAVMNATIGLYAYAHLRPRDDGRVRFEAADIGESDELDAAPNLPATGPALLHKGVYNRMVRSFNGGRPLAITVTTTVEAPAGSGLGSSSALTVALIEAYREYLRARVSEYDKARLAFEIERRDLALAGGRQDQYAAAFGGFNFMEFGADEEVLVNPLRVPDSVIRELEASIVLFFTGRSRDSADVIKQQQSGLISENAKAIDAMHQIKAEAFAMKKALLRGEVTSFGDILNRGWLSKKATAAGVSNNQVDALIEAVFTKGAYAAKLSGAGGGGFMFLMCDPTRRNELMRFLAQQAGGEVMPCHFVGHGAESWRI